MIIFNSPYETEEASVSFLEAECHAAFKELVAIIESYDKDSQFALATGRRVPLEQNRSFIVQRAAFTNYIKDNLLLIADKQLLPFCNKKDLMQRVDKCAIDFPQDLERTKTGNIKYQAKYEWCLQHPEIVAPIAYPELITVQAAELLQKGGNLLVDYVYRKFCDTIYKMTGDHKVQVPYGVEITDFNDLSFDYPDDIVTEMLNHYGHNRCINYTEPREIHVARIGMIRVEFPRAPRE